MYKNTYMGYLKFYLHKNLSMSLSSDFHLENKKKLGNEYARSIYDLLHDKKELVIDVHELRDKLFLNGESYAAFSEFRRRILDLSIELFKNRLGWDIKYELNKVGRTVQSIKFTKS